MALIAQPFVCDVCGRSKGEGNGWLLGFIIGNTRQVSLPAIVAEEMVSGYAIVGWNASVAVTPNPEVHHLCSEKCALTKQGEYLRR